MKTHLLRLGVSVLTLVTLASCVNPREKRIANNPTIYNALPASDQALVQQGRIREGFSKEAVFVALGRPDQVATGKKSGKSIEKWTYMGTQPVFTNTYAMGMGWGGGFRGGFGYCGPWDPFWGSGQSTMYVPYKAASVTFTNNRVTEYIQGPQ